MIPEKYLSLIEKLQEKTQKKEVIWQKTSRDNEFKLDLQNGAITVDKWKNERKNTNSVDVNIYNDRGDNIDRIYANESDNPGEYIYLETFHTEVRRAYYKVDETISGILDEITTPGKIGKEPPAVEDLPF